MVLAAGNRDWQIVCRVAMGFVEKIGRAAHFAWLTLLALPAACGRPRQVHRHLHYILLGALPLGSVTGVALGLVVWMHLHGVLLQFGSGYQLLLPQALA